MDGAASAYSQPPATISSVEPGAPYVRYDEVFCDLGSHLWCPTAANVSQHPAVLRNKHIVEICKEEARFSTEYVTHYWELFLKNCGTILSLSSMSQ